MRSKASSSVTRIAGSLPGILIVTVLCSAGLLSAGIAAAEGVRCEIGTSLGVTVINTSGGGDSDTHFGIPGGIGPLAPYSPAVYATIFATPSLMIEPQLSLSVNSSGGSSITFFTLAGQVGYLLMPDASGSPYLEAGGAIQNVSGGGSSLNGSAIGGEAGYRLKAGEAAAVRLKVHYRRWFSDFDETNEFGVGVGLGLVL